jgi:hypothetical protein
MSNNPLLGGSSPRYARRPGRGYSDLHASSEGSGRLFETMKHSDPTASGFRGRPPPPQSTFGQTATARKARRARSDIHGYSKSTGPQPPAMPRTKDSSIHGGGGEGSGIYGYQSQALRESSKAYEQRRKNSPKMASFTKQEVTKGLNYPPVIKNQGQAPTSTRHRADPNLHGGNAAGQRPGFLKATKRPSHVGHRSWAYQEKQFEANATGLPVLSMSPRNQRSNQYTRYYRPTTLDHRSTSSPRDPVTARAGQGLKGYDPARTSVLDGYSCYVKEHHQRAVQPKRTVLPPERSYRDFDKNSRNIYRQNQQKLAAQIQDASANPIPMPSAMMARTQGLQPVAPLGIYQWPRARRWGCSSGGWRE